MPINYYCSIGMVGSNIEMNKNQLLQPVIETGGTLPTVGSSVEGQMFFDNTAGDKTMYFFNGTAWVPMDGTGSGVSSVVTTDGTFIDLTPTTAATGAVTVTADLSATGLSGTPAIAETQFLRGDNTFAIPAGAYTSWSLEGDNATTVAITDTLRVDFTGGEGINTTVTAGTPNTLTIDLDINKLTTAVAVKTDFLAFSDEDVAGDPTKKATIADVLALGAFVDAVSAGDGIVLTGTASTPKVNVDYVGTNNVILSAAAAVTPVGADTIIINDATDDDVKQALISDLPFDSYSSWTLAGSTGTNQTISSGNTATFQGYAQDDALAGISTVGSDTDILKIGLDQSKIDAVATAGDTDYLLISDATSDGNERIPIRNVAISQWGDATTTIDMSGNKILDVANPTLAQDAATKAYVDGLVEGGLTFKGTFNALTGAIVSGGNSGSFLYQLTGTAFDPSAARVAVAVGDYYVVATAGNFYGSSGTGTCATTQLLDIGDSVIAVLVAAVNTSNCADWSIIQSDEGVTDMSADFGTFITGTDKTNAVGSVDLGAIDLVDNGVGTPSSATFYAGDGNWRAPAGTILTVNTTVSDQGIAITDASGPNVKVDFDITSITDDGTNLAVTDEFVYHDVTASKNFKGTIKNILDLGTQGIVSSISASTAVDEVGIIVTDGATATPEIGFSINSLGLISSKVLPGDELAIVEVSESPVEQKKVTVAKLTESHQTATTFATDISAFGAAVVGDTKGEVTHSLGSFDVIVQLYDNDKKTVQACVDRISVDKVQIDGNSFPASGDIRVLISKVG